MSNWKTVRLGDVGVIITGKTPPTGDADNFGSEFPFITPVDMNGRRDIITTNRYLSHKGGALMKRNLLPAHTICVSCIGSDLGKVVKTTRESYTNQQINSILCNDNFDVDFVYYAVTLLMPEMRNIGKQSTAIPIVNKTSFSNYTIKIPPLAEQQRIAGILGALDDKIELNNRINRNLEEQAAAIFRSWFVDFEPFASGEFIDSPLGKIPKGWRVGTLGDLIDFDPREKIDRTKDYKFFDMKCLSNDNMNISSGIFRCVSSASSFRNKDTLLAKITPCLENGKTGFVMGLTENEVARGSTEFVVMRNKQLVSPFWIYCLSRDVDFRNVAVQSMTGSSGRQRVQYTTIKGYQVAYSEEQMRKFDKLMTPIFDQIHNNNLQNNYLAALRDTLLPKLMNNET